MLRPRPPKRVEVVMPKIERLARNDRPATPRADNPAPSDLPRPPRPQRLVLGTVLVEFHVVTYSRFSDDPSWGHARSRHFSPTIQHNPAHTEQISQVTELAGVFFDRRGVAGGGLEEGGLFLRHPNPERDSMLP